MQDYAVVVIAQEAWVKFFPKAPKTIWPQQDVIGIHGVEVYANPLVKGGWHEVPGWLTNDYCGARAVCSGNL